MANARIRALELYRRAARYAYADLYEVVPAKRQSDWTLPSIADGRTTKGEAAGSKIGPLGRAERHKSRRRRPFSLESSGSLWYARGLRTDKWKIPVKT